MNNLSYDEVFKHFSHKDKSFTYLDINESDSYSNNLIHLVTIAQNIIENSYYENNFLILKKKNKKYKIDFVGLRIDSYKFYRKI